MAKRSRTAFAKWNYGLSQREVGVLSPRTFASHVASSTDLVRRLEIYKKLEKHRGCVNTVSFNSHGDILVSGSDDRLVTLWDWDAGRVKLSFHSGHTDNVFQAKIMPYTDDRIIVTCAADGQVRRAQILERGRVETSMLAKHQGRAHKLAIEPGSPHIFYTCGEDGLVQHFDLRTGTATELFTCKSFHDKSNYMPIVNLYAITIDPMNPNIFAVAGSDEYARIYDIRKFRWDGSTDFGQPTDCFCPPGLIVDELIGITGLAFSDQSELLVSYSDEDIYLFTRDMGLGPDSVLASPSSVGGNPISAASSSAMEANHRVQPIAYSGHSNCETVKGVSFFGPKCEYVVSGSDCGRIFFWSKKGGDPLFALVADKHVVNCIEPHPHATMLASSGIENDIKIWIPKATEKATSPLKDDQVLMHSLIAAADDDDDDDDDDDSDSDSDDDDDDDDDDENDAYINNDDLLNGGNDNKNDDVDACIATCR